MIFDSVGGDTSIRGRTLKKSPRVAVFTFETIRSFPAFLEAGFDDFSCDTRKLNATSVGFAMDRTTKMKPVTGGAKRQKQRTAIDPS